MIHRWIISVCDSVDNIITDGICVLDRWKNSVGKTVKSCSEMGISWVSDIEIRRFKNQNSSTHTGL